MSKQQLAEEELQPHQLVLERVTYIQEESIKLGVVESDDDPIDNSSSVVITLDSSGSSTRCHQPNHAQFLLSKSLNPSPPGEIPFSYQFQLKQVIVLDENGLGIDNSEEYEDSPEEEEEEQDEMQENAQENNSDREQDRQNEPIGGGMPDCVTISHRLKCLLIGTDGQLLFLDYFTKKFIKGIRVNGNISDMAVEIDGYKGGEALIVSYANHFVEKYDLEALFNHNSLSCGFPSPLWTSGTRKGRSVDSGRGFTDDLNYNWPEHLVVCYSNRYDSFFGEDPKEKHGNIVFVCDKWNNRIKVLRSSDGKYLGMFGTKGRDCTPGPNIQLTEPWGIDLDGQDRILTSEFCAHRVKRIDIQNGQMVYDTSFGSSMDMYNPNGIFVDKLTNKLIISDSNECSIVIINLENGQVENRFNNSSFRCVSDVCINYATGELYVTDMYSGKLFIYE